MVLLRKLSKLGNLPDCFLPYLVYLHESPWYGALSIINCITITHTQMIMFPKFGPSKIPFTVSSEKKKKKKKITILHWSSHSNRLAVWSGVTAQLCQGNRITTIQEH